MKMGHVEGQLEVGAGAGAFGNDSGRDIKPGCLGGGDGGANGADRVWAAGSSSEAWAAGTGLLGLGRTGMKPKTLLTPVTGPGGTWRAEVKRFPSHGGSTAESITYGTLPDVAQMLRY